MESSARHRKEGNASSSDHKRGELSPEQKKAIDRRGHAVVLAGAGSGKTSVIVQWYCRALLDYFPTASVEDVIAVTFTEKAASELKARIRKQLKNLRSEFAKGTDSQSRDRIERINHVNSFLMLAPIGTIHALCARLLRRFWREAGVDPYFVIVEEVQQFDLIQQAVERAIDLWESAGTEQPGKLAVLFAAFGSPKRLRAEMAEMLRRRAEFLKPCENFCQKSSEQLHKEWLATARENAFLITAPAKEKLEKAAQQIRSKLCPEKIPFVVDQLLPRIEEFESRPDDDGEKWRFASEWLSLMFPADGTLTEELLAALGGQKRLSGLNELREIHELLRALFDPTHPPTRQGIELAKVMSEFFRTVLECYRHLCDGAKNPSGHDLLDFAELELRTVRLLQNPEVRRELQKEIRALIVDEYQDTSDIQWEIFRLLLSPPESEREKNQALPWLYVVGDPYQAIYGWRQAGHEVFDKTIRWAGQQSAGEVVHMLSTNFRTQTLPLNIINKLCSHLFDSQRENRPNSEPQISFQQLFAWRANTWGQMVWLHYTPVDEKNGGPKKLRPQVAASDTSSERESPQSAQQESPEIVQVKSVVTLLKQIVGRGEPFVLKNENGQEKALQWGHVAFLCRKRKHFPTVELVLRASGIPFKTHAGSGFYERPEIIEILNALRVLADEEDSFSLLGFLRGQLIRCPDSTLFKLSCHNGNNLWQKCKSALGDKRGTQELPEAVRLATWERERIRFACDVLEQCQRRVGVTPIDQLITDILERTSAWAASGLYDHPEQVRENLKKLIAIAHQRKTTSLEGFLEYMDQQEASEEVEGLAPVLEESEQTAKILTVHAAKGLEYPIVVLPFLEGGLLRRSSNKPLTDGVAWFSSSRVSDSGIFRYLQEKELRRQEEEEKRVFYVALTRAQDLVVLSSSKPKRQPSGPTVLSWLNNYCERTEVSSWDELVQEMSKASQNVALKLEFSEPPPQQPNTCTYDMRAGTSLEELYSTYFERVQHLAVQTFPRAEPQDCALLDRPPFAPPLMRKERSISVGVSEFLTFLHCPRDYYEQYILELPPLLSESKLRRVPQQGGMLSASEKGRLLHTLIEDLLLSRPRQWNTDVEQKLRWKAKQTANESLDPAVLDELVAHVKGAYDAGKFERLLRAHRCWIEQYFLVVVDEKLALSGRTDCEYETEEGLVEIADFKTGTGEWEETYGKDYYELQMKIYLWMLATRFPHQPCYRATLLHTAPSVPSEDICLTAQELTGFGEFLKAQAAEFRSFLNRYAVGDLCLGAQLNDALDAECRRRKKPCPKHLVAD
ncbi:MAG: UvrD-helicase domain-containing protein [Candidatus Sumerlaeaceae bacterium]